MIVVTKLMLTVKIDMLVVVTVVVNGMVAVIASRRTRSDGGGDIANGDGGSDASCGDDYGDNDDVVMVTVVVKRQS